MNTRLNSYFATTPATVGTVFGSANTEIALESAVNALTVQENEVNAVNGDIASMEAIAVGLEALQETAQSSLADGGLDRLSGVLLQQGADAYTNQLGFSSSITPSQESFGGASDRLNATQISVEGLKETAKSIWNAILKAIRTAMNAVKEWFRKFMEALPAIKKRAEAIKEKAENETGTIENKDFVIGGVAKALHINGTVGKMDATVDIVSTVADQYLGKFYVGQVRRATGLAKNTKLDVKANPADILKTYQNTMVTLEVKNAGGEDLKGDKRFSTEGVIYTKSNTLPGNKFIVSAMLSSTDATVASLTKAYSAFRVTMTDATAKEVTVKTDAKFTTMSTGDIITVCDKVIAAVEMLEDFNKTHDKVNGVKEDIIKASAAVSKELEDESVKGEIRKVGEMMVKSTSVLVTTLDSPGVQLSGHVAGVLKAVLSVCTTSLAQYKEAK